MFKSRKAKDTARRLAALTLAFLMVFQYTASGLSIYSWAEDNTEAVQEEQQSKLELTAEEESKEASEEAEKQEEPKQEELKEEVQAETPVQEDPVQEVQPEQQTEEPAPEEQPEQQAETEQQVEQGQEQSEEQPEEEPQEEPEETGDEEDKEDEKDEEAKYPAQNFVKTVSGVTVRIDVPEDALPEGSTVVIKPVSGDSAEKTIENSTGDEVKVVKAMDITFKDADGIETEPRKKVSVNFEYEAFGQIVSPKVYHIDDNGQAEKLADSNIGVYNDQVSFNAQDFSTYVVADGLTAEANVPEVKAAEDTPADPVEKITITFDPTTDPDEQLEKQTVEIAKGSAIGDQLPAVPEVPGYITKWVVKGTEDEVTAETVVTKEFEAVVAKEKIEYTVTFVQEDGTTETRTTSIDDGFAINDLPTVTPKTNKVGKWVYPGTTNEFTVGTVVSENMTVDAYYEQNIFTVKFMVDNAQYEEMTTATGAKIVLPSDPIKAGATFNGWFTEPNGQGTEYTKDSTVNEDLTLYAFFSDQVRVSFIVKDRDGNVISEKSQYFIDLTVGDKITTLPDDPFVAGEVFDYWKNEKTGEKVEVGTTVTESFDAVAVFKDIEEYDLTVNYFYKDENGTRHEIQTQVYDLVESDFPYTVTAPGFTIAYEVTDDPTYYPSQPTITVNKDEFNKESGSDKYTLTKEIEFVAADAKYKVGHYLKDLSGNGYTLIESVDKVGVKGSTVTPDINNYEHAAFDHRDENVELTGDEDQELKVYYDRRDFTLSYNVGEGEYIAAETKPYGTTITLPTSATRSGYEFAGWYKDSACTQSAGTSITLEENTTLYAKWNAGQSEYKIVYMIENADDDGYSYLATVTKTAATGSPITMDAQSAGAAGTRPNDLDRTNFTFKDSTTETVKADGTTVVVVRYSRNVYTITWEGSGYELDGNRARWRTGRGRATLTAKYGANISAEWTRTFNTPHPNWAWNFSSSDNDQKFTSLDIMPSGNRTVYHWYYSTSKTQVLNYWFENYEGTQTKTYNGRTYGLFKAVTVHYNYLYDTDYPDYAGYTKGGWVRSDGARSLTASTPNGSMTADFYYNAEQYPLTFYNYDGSLISTDQVTLNANIYSRINNAIPDAPMEGAEWKGWYTDAEHNNKYEYSANTKMPAGLVLYGDFKFPTRTIEYDSQGGTDVASETDAYGFIATKPEDPTKENYTFQGWYTEPGETGSPYDWNQPVENDIKLYAHWTQDTISYTVHYYEKGTTNSILPDKVVSDPTFRENQSITENAPTVAGHVADEGSKTIKLSFDDENNTITFYYDEIPSELTYTVNYVLRDHPDIKVAESKTVTVPGTTTNAMEMAVEVNAEYMATQTSDADILGKHYRPAHTTEELQLGLENNVITFEYIPYTTSKITVNYLDMDGNSVHDAETTYVEKGDTFTVQNKAPDGYVYHHAYLAGTTEEPEPTYQITGNEGDLVINIYYQRKLIIIANNKSKTYDGEALFSSFDNTSDYTVVGNLRGDKLTAIEFDGSQTNAGTSATTPKNAQITKGAQAVTDPDTYYSIIYVPGSLTVKPVSVYISISADQWTTHSGSTGGPNYYTGKTFNVGFTNPGKQHFNDNTSKSAYVSITSGQRARFKAKYGEAIWNTLYGENGALISEKDAGSYTFTGAEQRALLAGIKVDGQSMMSDPNYSITLYARDSLLKIEPLPLTITTPSDEKQYDGTALTKSEGATLDHNYWTANIGGEWTAAETAAPGQVTLGTGETITFEVTGTQTPVGNSDNSYSIDWGENKSSNYRINSTLGTLTVTTKAITLTAPSDEKVYDGTELTCDGTGTKKVTADALPTGFTLEATATGTRTDVGTADNIVNDGYIIKDADGNDRTDNFVVTKAKGTLEVKPKKVTITTGSGNKEYDGTPLTNAEANITGLVEGETATVTATGSQTPVGSSSNTYSIDWGTTNKDNYTITEQLGTLTVTANTSQVKLTAANDSKTYDGNALENPRVVATGLPEFHTIIATASGSQTDAGSSANVVNDGYIIRDKNLNDVTANFTNVTKVNGTLTVNPAPLTVTTGAAEKEYDGTPLTKDEATITGFVNGETATVKATGSQTEVGSSDNTYTVTWGTAKESNYTITEKLGTLVVTTTDNPVTLTAATDSKTYDGKALTNAGVTASGLPEGFTVEATATGSQTNAGSSTNKVNDGYVIKNAAGEDKTANFTSVTKVDGTLTVNKAPVTIATGSDSKAYDGTALTKDEASITGLVNNETATVTATGSQTEVGSSDNTYSIDWGTTNKDNYKITENLGTLTVTESSVEVVLTAATDSKTYDGTPLTNADVTASGLPEGFTVVATASGSQTDAGSSANKVNDGYIIKNAAGQDKTANFKNVKKVDGTLTVNKAAVTITTGSASKAYDGTAVTSAEKSITGLVNGETATVTATGSQIEVGSSDNTYSIDWGTTNKDNYTVTENLGTLTITKNAAEVTLTAGSAERAYNGSALTDSTVTPTGLPEDFTVEATTTGSQTDAGSSANVVNDDYVIKDAQGNDKTANFTNVKKADGTLTVTPKAVTITTGSAEKEYDGTPLTKKDGYTVEGIVEGETYGFEVTGTITEVGSTSNTYTITWKADDNSYTAKEGNYTVTSNPGTLTIKENTAEVTLTAASAEKPYDGTPLTKNVVTATGLPTGFTVEATASGSQTDAGSSANKVNNGYIIKNAAGQDKTANFKNVKKVDGTLTVNPIEATVTIVGHNNTTDYDGADHTVTGYEVTNISTTLYTASDFEFKGTATATRKDAGTTNMGLAADQFVNNNTNFSKVTFQITDGYQTINKIDVTVTIVGNNNTTDYDGNNHTVEGYTVTNISSNLYHEADFRFSGTKVASRTDVGTTYMGLTASQFTNTNSNFNIVTFQVTDGYQEITPLDVTVTITGNNSTLPYDGIEHKVEGYTATASTPLYKVDGETKDFTFSGTAEAARTNVGTTNMNLAAGQFANINPNFGTVTFEVTDGYQKIEPIDITVTITGHNNTTTYDGEEHSVSGYDVEISNPLYKEADFTFTPAADADLDEGKITARRTDEGTTSMGLKPEQFANKNGNFGTVTFNVTDGYQTITPVDEIVVTITGHTSTLPYDGTEHSVSGYDVSISNPLYKEADFSFSGTAEAKRTDAGTTNMGLKAEQFTNNNRNFKKVTFNVTDGYQTITPINVTVTIVGANNTTAYDGTEHSVSGYTATADNDLYDVTKDFTFSGTAAAARTDAGTTNMGLKAEQFANKNGNFGTVTFNVTDGYQTITPISVVVTIIGNKSTDPYDGAAHTVTGYTATANNKLYDVNNDFTFSGNETATRTNVVEGDDTDGKTEMGLAASQFANKNENFSSVTFEVTDGYQEITPITAVVTITGHISTVPYDGAKHTVEGYTATTTNPLYKVTGDNIDFEFSGTATASRTDVVEGTDTDGQTDMGLADSQFSNKNPNFSSVTFNVADGYQKITPIDVTVTITGKNDTADYDGEEHKVTGYSVSSSTDLYTEADFTFSGTAEAKRTDAGTTNMNLTASQFANTNTNFGTVTFNVTDGYQTINPIEVTVQITGHTNSTVYDGQAHTVTGYDVQISNKLYKESDFTFTGTASATQTEQGKKYMGLTSTQFENTNGNFSKVTFNVVDGWQEVTKKGKVVVTITGAHASNDYDSTEHQVSGYTVQISDPLYKETDFTFTPAADATMIDDKIGAKRTNVVEGEDADGKTDMGLAKEQFKNINENFENVTFVVNDGYQEIKPINVTVTITGNNHTDDYNGKEHTVTGYTASASNNLYKTTGDDKDFEFKGNDTASRTDAGQTDMGLKADDFTNKNSNFGTVTFQVTDGYQKINPINATVTIVGNNNTADYDGKAHTVKGYTATADISLYDVTKDYTFTPAADAEIVGGEIAATRTIVGQQNMGLKPKQFANNNPNFATVTFNVTDGYQKIDPIDVTVTIVGNNNTTDYDGNAHTVTGYTAKADNDLYDVDNDIKFEGNASATRTDAGTTNMGLEASQFKNINDNFRTVAFQVTDGYQTINPITTTVTIVGANNTTDYDGESHTVTGYTATAGTALYDVTKDFTFSGTASATRTDAGQTDMGLKADQFTNTNENFSSVEFVVTDGFQKINPIDVEVEIVGANNTTDYDSNPHTVNGYTAEANNNLYDVTKDFTFSGNDTATRTNAGTTPMGLKAEQFHNTNENFATVTFKVTDGYQTINPINATVTITGHFNSTTYDSHEHSVKGYEVVISNPLYKEADFTFTPAAGATLIDDEIGAKRTKAGKTMMGLSAEQFENKNGNFATVTFIVTDGYQQIVPVGEVVVTITGHHATHDYDGTEYKANGYDVTISDPLYTEDDFTFSGTAAAARTNAGTTNMGLKPDQFTNNSENFETVTFNVTDGYVTINKINAVVTITGANNTTDYDGEAHTVKGYTAKADTDLYDVTKDFTFTPAEDATIVEDQIAATRTDAGTTNMGLAPEQFANTNENFETVTFNVTDGYQKIDPIDVTVTIVGKNNTTDYDGEAHTVKGYTATAGSNLYDVTKDFTFSGNDTATRTDAGQTDMGLKAEQFTNTNANFKTVTFDVTDGYQKIDPIDVTVTIVGKNNTTDYDGNPHTVTGYTATAGSTLYDVTKDFTFSGTDTATRTDAGQTNMGLKAEQFTNTNKNFKTVTFDVTDGYQKIDPISATVTIIGANNTTDYDGEAHTVTGYTATADTALYDVTKNIKFTGDATATRTDAGTTNMGLTLAMFENTSANFKDVTFKVTDGYQTINPIDVTVTITGHHSSVTYDSKEHSVSGYDVEIANPLYKEADFTFSGTAEAARTRVGTTNMGLAADQFKNNNENFKTVTFNVTDGYQTIVPVGEVVVTITGHHETAVYDGTEHGAEGFDVEISDPLYTESDFTFDGEATAVRTSAGTTNMGLADNQFANINENFEKVTFNVTDGYVTITKASIVVNVTGHTDDDVVYDGTQHTVSGYDVRIPEGADLKADDIRFTGTAEASGTNAGKYDMGLTPEQFENTNENYNVEIRVTDGSLTIAPRTITVAVTGRNGGETVYNGQEQSVTGYTVTSEDDLFKESDVAFSGDATAKGTNVGTYSMGLNPSQFASANPNFAITFEVEDGSLTITPKTVTVKADDVAKYVGAADPEFTATVSGLAEGDSESVISYAIRRAGGEAAGTYDVIVSGDEAQGNYIVTFSNGTLTINEIPAPDPEPTPTPDPEPTPEPTPTPDPDDDDDPTPAPAPDDDDDDNGENPARGNVAPNNPAPAAAVVPFTAPQNPQNINPNDVPTTPGNQNITDNPTPQTTPEPVPTPTWALLNLLCAIATVLLSLIVLLAYLGKNKKKEDSENTDNAENVENEDEAEAREEQIKKKGILRLIDIIPAIVSVVTFILTEDMSNDMVLVDQWTLLMVAILIVGAVVAVFTKKTTKENDDEEQKEQA